MMTWKHKWTHYLGVSTSLLCLVHCLAMPLLILLFPTFTSLDLTVIDSFWEYVFVALTIVSVLTIVQMHNTHKRFTLALPLAFTGVLFLTISLYVGHEAWTYFLPTGSVMILCAHLFNFKMCRDHKNCSHTKTSYKKNLSRP
ncbi:MAG: MerC domain-containing protein [Bdellovibrionaceae bacterium]|nr:MerC domain-containing protein [Pseudobdellovibrionaceae bacterium]